MRGEARPTQRVPTVWRVVIALVVVSLPAACAPTTGSYLSTLRREARILAPLVRTGWVRDFLAATRHLVPIPTRRLLCDRARRRCFREADAARLPPSARGSLRLRRVTSRDYYARYGSPLAYARVLDLAARAGLGRVAGTKILDFGYGSIGQVRLLALLGARVTGVDPDQRLAAWYGAPSDQGRVAAGAAGSGSVRLLTGRFPADPATRDSVGVGYDLIVAKNVLKEGYLRPRRAARPEHLIQLGVGDSDFLRALFRTVRPAGLVVVYNLYPRQNPPPGRYIPWADGKTAFRAREWRQAGFEVRAYDVDDTVFARRMGRRLGWDRGPGAMKLEDLFAVYSVFRRPR